ncbi:helix-turn-helix domain-containing protein [Salimicrobium humidisoli]|uniref:XRE family transcriptional regulator n=1 Tax=Salimicrobium humidisoli TaxID=2029857 RepID=A0ABX4HRP5_9BACI|nr:helix-turn-helix transcriptional regulator [Salimicrobium humidisoli]PBB05748.1 XRE family transcriptional regulator [Salimicrobium humidisoli]
MAKYISSKRLKTIMDERGLSIRALATATGLKYETIRRLRNDQTKQYQRDSLAAVCVALGVEVEDILTLEEAAEG